MVNAAAENSSKNIAGQAEIIRIAKTNIIVKRAKVLQPMKMTSQPTC